MCKYALIALALMLPAYATLLDLPMFDYSNVDFKNFQYFKNLASQNPRTAAQANPLLEHFQKKKAVLDYLDRLFFGNSPFTQPSEIPFDPHFGKAWRPHYQRKFGYRGERLIAALGSGYSVKQLRTFGAIPYEFGTGYYPS
ncbi:uncharacterized protein LOC115624643 [Scaptodrosophila lebanonensis]|uniref:Uncharacterized protein LOC115624643 n=1 Tax=Drosophila lebanonensis TaxID=7225 RepID=A0A6J2TJU3_DROLE|nr:uncharacterized protein LOC115624643 [Scaptodrosophila lebanonensis]